MAIVIDPHALVELSKLDGAFVVRGDGYIQSAAVFLATTGVETQLPSRLRARHIAEGQMVLQLDPDVPRSPTAMDEDG